ncbi:MAG TPA: SulP family inorganic anion transporter, partial [Plasticicumulans sp.]|nr:SulP family inorganic anion transporter [Plasticicumulans sp.]
MLARLEIADFRNLAAVRLDCAPGLNLISGDNAAGKTSLLEAVYLLGRARSFRTQRPAELIRRGAAHWRLVARLGTWIKYIPEPVVTGFTAGIAVIIFSSQVKDLLGLTMASVPADF